MDTARLYDLFLDIIATYGLDFLLSLLIFFVGWWITKLVSNGIRKLFVRRKADAAVASFITNLVHVTLLVVVIIAVLSRLGVQTASLVAVLGAAGLAIGLALQDSLANFAAGILMITLRPFKIGDYIEGAGTSGTVEDIGLFVTTCKTPDNKKVVIPNTKLMSDNIVNYTALEIRRLDMVIGVSYDDEIRTVESVLLDILDKHERVLKEPPPAVGILQFADSSVEFAVRPWVRTVDYWDVYFDLHKLIKEQFDKQHITIPYPQQDIHLHNS